MNHRRSWWFGRTQDKATTRQPGILCGWSGRLEQSTTGHSFHTYIINFRLRNDLYCVEWGFKLYSLTYIINFQKHAKDTICSHVPTLLFLDYEQRTLYGTLVVTLAILLHLINSRFIIIIIFIDLRFQESPYICQCNGIVCRPG